MIELYQKYYADHRLIEVTSSTPEVREGANNPGAVVGGFSLSEDGRHLVVVCVIDNLLKGASVQALQNLIIATVVVQKKSFKEIIFTEQPYLEDGCAGIVTQG